MKRTPVNGARVDSVHRFRHRLALHRALSAFAIALNALRHRRAWSFQELSKRTDIPVSRILELIGARAAPAWDEVLWFAWAFRVPATSLVSRLTAALDHDSAPELAQAISIASRPWETSVDRARKAYLLQKLSAHHGQILNLSLADWPAVLPPSLAECFATEATVMHINSMIIEECVEVITRLPDGKSRRMTLGQVIRTAGEDLDSALHATSGVTERLQALAHRHRLHRVVIELQPALLSQPDLAADTHEVLTQLQRPITILRAFEVTESTEDRHTRLQRLIELFPALDPIDCDGEPEDLPTSVTELPARDRQCAADILRDVGTSMLSISIELNRLAALAVPRTILHR